MNDKDIELLSRAAQLSYWMGQLLIGIGQGDLRSQLAIMIEFYQRTAYERGYAAGKESAK